MKINILFILFMLLGCETGTRYDKNTTIQKAPQTEVRSGLVTRDDIEALLDDNELEEKRDYDRDFIVVEEIKKPPFMLEEDMDMLSKGLDVRSIREGKHDGYIRLVFDVYDDRQAASSVGSYDANYNAAKKDITVILHGYKKFSAPLPSFPYYSVVEQIYFEQYPKNRGLKFHIKLREASEVKIFDLKNPARLVFDIKAI